MIYSMKKSAVVVALLLATVTLPMTSASLRGTPNDEAEPPTDRELGSKKYRGNHHHHPPVPTHSTAHSKPHHHMPKAVKKHHHPPHSPPTKPPTDKQPTHHEFASRIVGGTNADAGKYKFMVSWDGDCGGSLIAPNLVLTAAHCAGITGGVRIGSDQINSGGETRQVTQKCPHPNYNDATTDNDYLILQLDQPVDTNTYKAIQLNSDAAQPQVDEMLTVIGFGATSEGGAGSDRLQMVQVPTNSHATCSKQYDGVQPDIHLCAGFTSGGKDSCQGDSGGPIFEMRNGQPVQVGVVSFGDGCARPNKSGVYARVSGAYDWIQTTMSNLDSGNGCDGNGGGGLGGGGGGDGGDGDGDDAPAGSPTSSGGGDDNSPTSSSGGGDDNSPVMAPASGGGDDSPTWSGSGDDSPTSVGGDGNNIPTSDGGGNDNSSPTWWGGDASSPTGGNNNWWDDSPTDWWSRRLRGVVSDQRSVKESASSSNSEATE